MEKSIIDHFNDDDVYKVFTEEGFDAKAYATKVIEGHAISQQLAVLAEGINLVDKELHKQVVEHHEDLLSQAVGIETLEGVLQTIQARSQNLMAAVERIRTRVTDPYNKIVARNDQLRRLQETCDTLRQIIRAIYLSKRLRSQLQGGLKEITKAAQCLNELDYLATNGADLSGIEAIESDRKFVKQARKEVEMQSQKMLRTGLQLQNQTQVATSLQIFYNLNILEQTIDGIVVEVTEDVREITQNSLNVNYLLSLSERKSGPGKVSGLTTGNTAAFRASLWMNMEKLVDAMFSSYSQIFQLQKVLTRKRDPASHVLFIDHYKQAKGENSGNLLQEIWKNMTSILREEFNKTAENNTFLKQALEGEYPKQLRLFNDLWKRISSLDVSSSDRSSAEPSLSLDVEKGTLRDDYDPEKALNDCFTHFETAYLSKSLSRLFDPINLVFSSTSSSLPSASDLEGIVKTINSELTVASFDAKLCASVARNVSKTIVLFCSKFEQLLMTGSDVTQVIGPPTDAQTFNASIVNSLHKFYQATVKGLSTLQNIPPHVHDVINDALQGVLELMGNIVEPLLTSISQAIEDILLTMHNEDFSQASHGSSSQNEAQHCSLYMKELQQFVNRAVSSYIAQFQCSELVLAKLKMVAQRCLEVFVRHTSLIHPLGEGGKMRLANDYAQIEVVVANLCNKLSDLGKSYRVVRAVRPMLFQVPEHIVKNVSVGDVVPISIILQFFFARGYPQLRPAYQTAGWTCSRYSKWLDEHPNERDRLKFIKGSLESYAQSVTNRGGKEFVSIYPFMIDLLQRGLR